MMKKAFLLLWISCFSAALFASDGDFGEANKQYDDAEYKKAATMYLALTEIHPYSAELWYNLGNAYYKAGKNGYAVAAYRKAHKLNPTDKDIRFNLDFVVAKTADKISPKPKSFIVRQTDMVADLFTSGGWAFASLLFACIGLVSMLVYIFLKNYTAKKVGLVSALLFWIGSFFLLALAGHRYYYALDSYAIVVSSHADVLSEPNSNGTRLLLLNEGATLDYKERSGDWVKVELPNGTQGFVKTSEVEII